MHVAAQEWVPVPYSHRQPDALENGQIHDVVTDEAHFLVAQARRAQNLLIGRQLRQRPLLKEMDSQFLSPMLHHGRAAPGDDAGLEAGRVRQAEAQAVARVKRLGLRQPTLWARHIVDAAVGQDAVHVHQQELDSSRPRPELSRRKRHVGDQYSVLSCQPSVTTGFHSDF
jgi:hypothetical protein